MKFLEKALDCAIVVACAVFAVLAYAKFDLEKILWEKSGQEAVESSEIAEDLAGDYLGKPAGEGIREIDGKEAWEDLLNDMEYATAAPKSIVKTDVYSLAEWADPYVRRRNGTVRRRKAEARQTPLDLFTDYTPYYVVELEDGSHILAQMSRGIAADIEKGRADRLPIGQKHGVRQGAKELLAPICEAYGASADYVFYAVDNAWQESHSFAVFLGKAAVGTAVFFVLAVLLLLLKGKVVEVFLSQHLDKRKDLRL